MQRDFLLLFLLVVIILLETCVGGSGGRYQWKGCIKSTIFRLKWQCDSLYVIPDDVFLPSLEVYNGVMQVIDQSNGKRVKQPWEYVVMNYFWETPQIDICNNKRLDELKESQVFTTCEDYFCNNPVRNQSTLVTDQDYNDQALLINYCNYCARSDYNQFHRAVTTSADKCRSFDFPYTGHCSRSAVDGLPLRSGRLMRDKRVTNPITCHCPIFNRNVNYYAYKCDLFAYYVKPVIANVFPTAMVTIYLLLFLITLFAFIPPFLFKLLVLLKQQQQNQNQQNQQEDQQQKKTSKLLTTLLYLITCIFMLLHCMLLCTEFVIWFPMERMYRLKRRMGTGFFQSYSIICFILALFTLFTSWIHQLEVKKRKQSRLILILVIFYISIISIMGSIPLICLIPALKQRRILDRVFVPVVLLLTTCISLIYTIYGIRAYFLMKKDNPANNAFWKLKFSKFITVAVTLLLFIDFQLVFMFADTIRYSKLIFGIYYRYLSYPLAYFTLAIFDISILLQFTSTRFILFCTQTIPSRLIGRTKPQPSMMNRYNGTSTGGYVNVN